MVEVDRLAHTEEDKLAHMVVGMLAHMAVGTQAHKVQVDMVEVGKVPQQELGLQNNRDNFAVVLYLRLLLLLLRSLQEKIVLRFFSSFFLLFD